MNKRKTNVKFFTLIAAVVSIITLIILAGCAKKTEPLSDAHEEITLISSQDQQKEQESSMGSQDEMVVVFPNSRDEELMNDLDKWMKNYYEFQDYKTIRSDAPASKSIIIGGKTCLFGYSGSWENYDKYEFKDESYKYAAYYSDAGDVKSISGTPRNLLDAFKQNKYSVSENQAVEFAKDFVSQFKEIDNYNSSIQRISLSDIGHIISVNQPDSYVVRFTRVEERSESAEIISVSMGLDASIHSFSIEEVSVGVYQEYWQKKLNH